MKRLNLTDNEYNSVLNIINTAIEKSAESLNGQTDEEVIQDINSNLDELEALYNTLKEGALYNSLNQ